MPSDLQTATLADLLPASIAGDPTMASAATAVEPHLRSVTDVISAVSIYAGIDGLPATALDLLAWQFCVDFWSPELADQKKRDLLKRSIAWHKRKGTRWAVREMLNILGYPGAEIRTHADLMAAWTEAGGGQLNSDGYLDEPEEPLSPTSWKMKFMSWSWAQFSVRMNAADEGIDSKAQMEIRRLVDIAKPLRSHLVGIEFFAEYALSSMIATSGWYSGISAVYSGCKAADVPHFGFIGHGCEELGGSYAPDVLNGEGCLDGHGDLSGLKPVGEPLNDGSVATWWAAVSVSGDAYLGGEQSPSGTLTPDYTDVLDFLDGSGDLSVDVLDGKSLLDGNGDLSLPVLTPRTNVMLDGSETIGPLPGATGCWHYGTVRVWDGNTYTTEAI
jgi:P2-related tail formation protein